MAFGRAGLAAAWAVLLLALAGCAGRDVPQGAASGLGGTTAGSASSGTTEPPATPAPLVGLQPFAQDFASPVLATAYPSGNETAVVQQDGHVFLVDNGNATQRRTLLDISALTRASGEQGLLGLAFHPGFATGDARFYVDYTDRTGDSHVDEYLVVDPAAEPLGVLRTRALMKVDQPYSNHNGGMLAFGPDGMLYVGFGDGGDAGDPHGNGQDTYALLGKVLRIDVGGPEDATGNAPYRIPQDNPFADGSGGAREVWDYGLRNPWRFSFDREDGDLWIGDVGQGRWEEVDREAAGHGGNNYGWKRWEGSHLYDGQADAPGAVFPVAEYTHEQGCSITGGYVYRGQAIPALRGAYVYGDWCSGTVWGLFDEGGAWRAKVLLESGRHIDSFGEDQAGELLVVDQGGAVLRLVPG